MKSKGEAGGPQWGRARFTQRDTVRSEIIKPQLEQPPVDAGRLPELGFSATR